MSAKGKGAELSNSDLRSTLSPFNSFYYSRFFGDDSTLWILLKVSTLMRPGVADTGRSIRGEAGTRSFFILIKLCDLPLTFFNYDGYFAGVSTINRGLDPSTKDYNTSLLVFLSLRIFSSFVCLKTLSFVSTISCFSSSRTTSKPSPSWFFAYKRY